MPSGGEFYGRKVLHGNGFQTQIDVFAVAEQEPVFFCDALSPRPKFSDGPLPDSRIIRYPGLPHTYGVPLGFRQRIYPAVRSR